MLYPTCSSALQWIVKYDREIKNLRMRTCCKKFCISARWNAKATETGCLEKARANRQVCARLTKRQTVVFGNTMGSDILQGIAMTEETSCRRNLGMPKKKIIFSWKIYSIELSHISRDSCLMDGNEGMDHLVKRSPPRIMRIGYLLLAILFL